MENKFTEEDKKRFVEFMNMIAVKGEFKLNTQEIIKYFKLLSFVQQELLPKIDANIMEITKVVESEDSSEKGDE
jgi:hypothetical protein|tara:strand:- start:1330 stop:1551 length:222 start_codon:yes stop_codon:yes gene_type:complete